MQWRVALSDRLPYAEIARRLDRRASTISREVALNGVPSGRSGIAVTPGFPADVDHMVGVFALTSTCVDVGAAVAVGFGLADDLAGDGGDLALAEEEEAEEVGHRVALGPLEVDVGALAGLVADVQE